MCNKYTPVPSLLVVCDVSYIFKVLLSSKYVIILKAYFSIHQHASKSLHVTNIVNSCTVHRPRYSINVGFLKEYAVRFVFSVTTQTRAKAAYTIRC